MLPNGNVLMALSPESYYSQGVFQNPIGTYIYEFDPTTNQITPAGPAPGSPLSRALAVVPSYETRMLVLPNGHVLFSITTVGGVWDYAPDGSRKAVGSPPFWVQSAGRATAFTHSRGAC